MQALRAEGGDNLSQRRLETRIGYELPAFGNRFTATPELGVGISESSCEYRAGGRLGLAGRREATMELSLDARRNESVDRTRVLDGALGQRRRSRLAPRRDGSAGRPSRLGGATRGEKKRSETEEELEGSGILPHISQLNAIE